ncbi:MAG TPA: hypothetical protein VNU19_07150 [Candidatus Acidoferrum sp.]|jgi:hypothetical protein|nr:hypothetical protein [Candidatus Acidoferrum sp.]
MKRFKAMQFKGISGPPHLVLIDGWPYVVVVQAQAAIRQGTFDGEMAIIPLQEVDDEVASV